MSSNTLNMQFGSGKAEIAFFCKHTPIIVVLFTPSNILQCILLWNSIASGSLKRVYTIKGEKKSSLKYVYILVAFMWF